MRRPRFRLRTLIVVVAFVALVLGYASMSERRRLAQRYRALAATHAACAAYEEQATQKSGGKERLHVRRSAHYAGLAEAYERAARYPWLPVPPDPPAPE